jgi:Ca-activated chloride channel family protein
MISGSCLAQNDRSLIRQGNRAARSNALTEAETAYRKAISANRENSQAIYNLAIVQLAQSKTKEAMKSFRQAAELEKVPRRKAKSYHNIGTIYQNQRQYQPAIEAYKEALRLDPENFKTRYNLALCKKLLKNDNKNNNKNNKNNKKNKKKDQNKDKQKDQNKNKNKNKNDQNKSQNQQNQPKMSKQNAEQLLNAAIQQEKATKQRMNKSMSQPRRKQYDMNW